MSDDLYQLLSNLKGKVWHRFYNDGVWRLISDIFTPEEKAKLDNLPTKEDLTEAFNKKVDKEYVDTSIQSAILDSWSEVIKP